ncbi:MAG: S41 family peptidase [Desulfobacula sp.]|nr:S41 family peptidase [Desulfobacula sp.]
MKIGFLKRIRTGRFLVLALYIMFASVAYMPSLMADDATYNSLKLFTDVLDELQNNYVDDIDSEKLIQNAIKGMVGGLDPHSHFMPPDVFEVLREDTKGEFSGVGIVVSMKKGILTVISPIEDTPAFEAGVQAGDMIIKIDDKTTKDMELWEAVTLLRGPKNETVVITVIREGETKPIKFPIKRDIIPMESARASMLKPGFAYLRITNFRMNTYDDVKKHLEELESEDEGIKGLVMDLRDNPGGLLDQAVKISDLFLTQGDIVSIKGRSEANTKVFEATQKDPERAYPIVILINGGSASASEIVAGALQDHSRALVLGTKSFGKGSVQTVHPLKEGYGIKYTIAKYYTPKGKIIQDKGVEPDIEVSSEILQDKKAPPGHPDIQSQKNPGQLDKERLLHDAQVKRALDILISYEIFSNLNAR